jgi:uncharacterized membrane protein
LLTAICGGMAFINVLIALSIFVPGSLGDTSSIAQMFDAPTLVFGAMSWIVETIRALATLDVQWLGYFVISWYVMVVVVHVRLLMLLIRKDRELRTQGRTLRRIRLY